MNKHPEEKTVLILSLLSIIAPPVSWFSFFMARKQLKEVKAQGFDSSIPMVALVISITMMVIQVISIILGIFLAIAIYSSFYSY